MSNYEVLAVVIATLLGPILAVQVQKFIERSSATKNRKEYIFYSLMATRATKLANDHVAALNSIDLNFRSRKDRAVVDAWRQYIDHLNQTSDPTNDSGIQVWADRREVLFIDLLYEMSRALGYDFDKVQLKRSIYYPRGHGENEETQRKIQLGLLKVLQAETPLAMNVVGFPVSDEALALQTKLQKGLIDVIEGKGELHITMKQKN